MLALILILTAGSAVVVLAYTGPLHTGDALYPLQSLAERGAAWLKTNPYEQAMYRLELLERRAGDLTRSAGAPAEPKALSNLSAELERAVGGLAAIGNLPSAKEQALRRRLEAALEAARRSLAGLLPGSQAAAQLQARLDRLLENAGDPSLPLSALGVSPAQSVRAAAPLASAAVSGQVVGRVSPHAVRFQPGSLGAMHAFFPLDGAHAGLDCTQCHSGGRYAGVPNTCAGCHAGDAPAPHFPGACTLCHTTAAWTPASFDHNAFDTRDCSSCHRRDKPAHHWSGQCSVCHSTSGWTPAHFDHAVAGATDCISCHSGDKPAGHWSAQCSACHGTGGWLPAHFDHGAAGATDCTSCHSGDKPAGHWSVQCSACHNTGSWKGASFNHGAVGATDCQSCHNPPRNHFAGQCSQCHGTRTWAGATFNHSFPMNHGGANGQCSACHVGGGTDYDCFKCHNQNELDKKHNEKGIPDYASHCLDCHSGGKGGGD